MLILVSCDQDPVIFKLNDRPTHFSDIEHSLTNLTNFRSIDREFVKNFVYTNAVLPKIRALETRQKFDANPVVRLNLAMLEQRALIQLFDASHFTMIRFSETLYRAHYLKVTFGPDLAIERQRLLATKMLEELANSKNFQAIVQTYGGATASITDDHSEYFPLAKSPAYLAYSMASLVQGEFCAYPIAFGGSFYLAQCENIVQVTDQTARDYLTDKNAVAALFEYQKLLQEKATLEALAKDITIERHYDLLKGQGEPSNNLILKISPAVAITEIEFYRRFDIDLLPDNLKMLYDIDLKLSKTASLKDKVNFLENVLLPDLLKVNDSLNHRVQDSPAFRRLRDQYQVEYLNQVAQIDLSSMNFPISNDEISRYYEDNKDTYYFQPEIYHAKGIKVYYPLTEVYQTVKTAVNLKKQEYYLNTWKYDLSKKYRVDYDTDGLDFILAHYLPSR